MSDRVKHFRALVEDLRGLVEGGVSATVGREVSQAMKGTAARAGTKEDWKKLYQMLPQLGAAVQINKSVVNMAQLEKAIESKMKAEGLILRPFTEVAMTGIVNMRDLTAEQQEFLRRFVEAYIDGNDKAIYRYASSILAGALDALQKGTATAGAAAGAEAGAEPGAGGAAEGAR